jgi:Protein of unknown function (DUF1189).
MRKFTWWQALWLSFFSRQLYQSVARQWRGIGSLYLLILSILVVMPVTMEIRAGYRSFIENDLPLYLDELPVLTIQNGTASTPEQRPYIINEKGTTDPFIVVDTSGKITDLEHTSAPVLITADRLYIRKSDIETRSFDFSTFTDITIDRSLIEAFLTTTSKFVLPLTYLILVTFAWSWRITQAMVYALLAGWFARKQGFSMRYPSFVRISAVALTPAILIDMLLGILGLPLPFAGVLFAVLEVMYLRFAIQSIAQLPADKHDDEGSIIA